MLLGTPGRSDEDPSIRFSTIPKRHGGFRVIARLAPPDDIRYRNAVAMIAARVESSLPAAVVAERATTGRDAFARGPAFSTEGYRSARRRFRSRARALARSRPGAVVLADVRSCFASITAEVVGERLLRLGCHPAEVGSVLSILERFGEHGVAGLPVGPHASAVLANAVLGAADEAIAASGARHLRWVDDFLVFPRRERDAHEVLERLAVALDERGLELAAEKCAVEELYGTPLGRSLLASGNGARVSPVAASLG
ncbi:MAG: RNA-directed DNA polymerase [Actinomycetota bacterium]|nr:RNA-directed DNA polymerase [Actinomycetota bacterium]